LKARISGRAAAFAIKRAGGWELGRRGCSERTLVREMDVTRVLGGTPDVVEIEVATVPEVERRLETEWCKDRALRLMILLLDPDEPDVGLEDAAILLEKLLDGPHVIPYIEDQFCQQELPDEARIDRAQALASNLPAVWAMLSRISEWQSNIGQVRESFESLGEGLFGGADEKAEYRERAIAAGAFRSLVGSTVLGKLTDAGIFELHAKLRDLPEARKIAKAWASSFERVATEMPPLPADLAEDFEEDIADFGGGSGGHQQLRNALEQQHAILAKVSEGDYDNARRFARDLAQQQRAASGQVYLAKSLTRLSQGAREMEAFDLDLEWSHAAVECQPGDVRTHTQYADALLQVDRFDEALEQFDIAAELGERGYAATGRARALRLLGRYEDALDAFSRTASEFKDTEHEIYALVGVSNVKSDIGDVDGALSHSAEVVDRFPYEPIPRLNLASLLVRRGRFQQAWSEFTEAEKLSTSKLAALNGLAEICRRTGRLPEARSRYAEIAARYPRDVNAHIGLIDTLRSLGETDKASMYARRTAERFPGSPRAAARQAETASEMGRHPIARKILDEAIKRFPKDARLILARASAFRRSGRYDRALTTIDAAVERFPYNRRLRRARADMLRRLGQIDAAEAAYRELVEEDQLDTRARNGLAALLTLRDQFDLASKLVENDDPATADEWRSFLLRATLEERQGDVVNSRKRLSWALDRCPFAAERRLFACAIARQAAAAGRARHAPKVWVLPERDIGNLINFQIEAMTRSPRVKKAYTALRQHIPARYETLRDEIAGAYGVWSIKPQHTKNWINRQIDDEFLLAAA